MKATGEPPRSEPAGAVRAGAQILGVLISALTAAIWLGVLWLPSERDVLGHFGVVGAVVMLFIALLGTMAAYRGHGNFMLGLFLAAFLPIGAFMLWTTEPMYRWLGLLNLAYFVTAVVVRKTRGKDRGPAGKTVAGDSE